MPVFFNSYVNPIAFGKLGWKYYIVYCCWLAFELIIVYFFYIETRNTPLEEMAKHFDGDDAVIGGAAANEKSLQRAKSAGLNDTLRTASVGGMDFPSYDGKSSAIHMQEIEHRRPSNAVENEHY